MKNKKNKKNENLQPIIDGLIEHSKQFYDPNHSSAKTFWEPYHKLLKDSQTLADIKIHFDLQFYSLPGAFERLIRKFK